MSPHIILLLVVLLIDFVGNLPTGALPLGLAHDGASTSAIAIAMGCGMFVSLLGSVPIGVWADRFGALAMLRLSALILVISLVGLASLHGAMWASLFMAMRGFAFTAYLTSQFAYAGAIFPAERVLSIVATLGLVGNLSYAIAPALSVFLWQHGVGRMQFGYASVFLLLGIGLSLLLPGVYRTKARRTRNVYMRSKWIPAMVFAAGLTLQSGVNLTLAVLTFQERGIANGALIFSVMSLTIFALRYPASRLVERFGARTVAVPVAFIQIIGCVVASGATTSLYVVIAGMCLGFAWSAMVPVAISLLFEHSSKGTRGTAMGAYNLALSIGAAGGALLAAGASAMGFGYTAAILVCTIGPLVSIPLMAFSPRSSRTNERTLQCSNDSSS